ncbi:capsid protein [Circoviridae sp.]|nr:capsid protein [Circoviridae sp.]UOF79804.1 capsid protein [Circoviridae sp.]
MAKYGRRRRVRKSRSMRKYTKRSRKGRSRYRKMRKYRAPKLEKKKWVTYNDGDQKVGQLRNDNPVSQGGSGHSFLEITPKPPQGLAALGQRVGDVINLSGVNLKFQFNQQTATAGPIKLKIYVLRYKPGYAGDMTTNIGGFLDANAFLVGNNAGLNAVYDYRSNRNQTAYPAFEIMAYKKARVAPDTVANMTQLTDVNFTFKKNHTIRFQPNSTTIQSGQIFTLVLADAGSCGTAATAYTQVATNVANSGLLYRFQHTFYYTDA